ncbi:MAG: hypothetical protein AB1646_24145 [Thermodesulfobacteriota bacterium]
MEKRTISLKAVVQDLRSGMDDQGLMSKHGLTDKQLQMVLRRAVEKGVISEADLESRQPSTQPEIPPPPKAKAPKSQPERPISEPPEPPSPEAGIPDAGRTKWRLPWVKISIIVLFVCFVLMVKFLPWWVSVAGVVLGVPVLIWLAKFLFVRFFTGAFEMKSKALAGAQAAVREVRPAAAPETDEEDGDDEESADFSQFIWYHVDVTITPAPQSKGFTHWEPGELRLAGMDAKPKDTEGESEELAEVYDYKIFSDGKFCEDEAGKHVGPLRLELHVGVKPGVSTLQFRYYFELFGRVTFPRAGAV